MALHINLPKRLAIASISLFLGGCSFAFVEGPPPDHQHLRYFDCSSGRLAPVVDLTLAATLGLATLGAASSQDSSSTEDAVMIGALAGAAAASAVYGFHKTGVCRDAKEMLASRLILSAPQPAPQRPLQPEPAQPPAADPWLSHGAAPGANAVPSPTPPAGTGAPTGAGPAADPAPPPATDPQPPPPADGGAP